MPRLRDCNPPARGATLRAVPPSCASVSFIPRSRARGGGKERLEAGADTLAIGIVSVPASHEGHGVKLPGVSNRRAHGAKLAPENRRKKVLDKRAAFAYNGIIGRERAKRAQRRM